MNEMLKELFERLNISSIINDEFDNVEILKAEYILSKKITIVTIENNHVIPLEMYCKINDLLKRSELNIKLVYKTNPAIYSEAIVYDYYQHFIKESIRDNISTYLENISLEFDDNDLSIKFQNDGIKMMFESYIKDLERWMLEAGFNISYTYEVDNDSTLDNEIEQSIKDEEMNSLNFINQRRNNENYNAKKFLDYDQVANITNSKNISKIIDLTDEIDNVNIEGYVFDSELIKTKKEKHIQTLKVTDFSDSLLLKRFETNKIDKEELLKIKNNSWIKAKGNIKFDDFANEYVMFAKSIETIKSRDVTKYDTFEDKRVELHLHTNMSTMDGISSSKEYIKQAVQYGHTAIAFSDFNNVQAYPEIYKNSLQSKLKIIYGMESNLIEDKVNIVLNENDDSLIDSTFVYFDFETTGFHAQKNDIIEIGAVKYQGGLEIDRFQSFVKTNQKLSLQIKTLTNISENDLEFAPTIQEILPDFVSFCENSILVAHNASFDYGFLKYALKKVGLKEMNNSIIDTLELSRFLDKKRKQHNLGATARAYGVKYNTEIAHRADYDAVVLGQVFERMKLDLVNKYHVKKISDINNLQEIDYLIKQRAYRCTILCLNQNGLKDLFKLVSLAHTKFFYEDARLFKSSIIENRNNLLIGSGTYYGEIYQKIGSEDEEKIKERMSLYDYIEVVPPSNLKYLVDRQDFKNIEEIEEMTKEIIRIAKSINKLVVAVGDVYYNLENQKEYRDVYIYAKATGGKNHYLRDFKNRIEEYPTQHFRTTDEMLEEFNFLDEELAKEIVITNTNLLANKIDMDIKPIKDSLFAPQIDGVDDLLIEKAYNTAYNQYGNPLPNIVKERLEKELQSIIKHGFAVVYYISSQIVEKSLQDGYLVGSRGSVGSSLVATMANITEVNPLKPHYYCPNCQYSDFEVDKAISSGYDLVAKKCPHCNHDLKGDGQDIPFETFLGFEGDKVPDIDLNFSGEYQNIAHEYTREIFGEDNVFRAGTIGTVQERTAYGFALGYHEEKKTPYVVKRTEYERLAKGCTGVKRTTGQHPGGIIVIPNNMDVHDFTPVNYPADDKESNWKTTHFDFHAIDENVLKFDLLGHVDPTAIRMLQDLTQIDPKNIPTNDPKVISLFSSNNAIGIANLVNYKNAAIGIPEFGTNFVRNMLEDTKPQSFADLVQISGLSHGTDVWLNNAQSLIKRGVCTLSEVIGCRDDIMVYLMNKGIQSKMAFDIMEAVRKGKGLKDNWIKTMQENNVPQWYIDSCQKIKYMFPKAHAVAYVLMAIRVAWFKVYYPLAYYATYFSTRCDYYEIETMIAGVEVIKVRINEIMSKGNKATDKEKALISVFEVAIEMYLRGFTFLPIDLKKSDSSKFVVDYENNAIIPSFISIDGLGISVANKIVTARTNKPFLSKEDLEKRGQLNKNHLAFLKKIGSLDYLQDANQLSLF